MCASRADPLQGSHLSAYCQAYDGYLPFHHDKRTGIKIKSLFPLLFTDLRNMALDPLPFVNPIPLDIADRRPVTTA